MKFNMLLKVLMESNLMGNTLLLKNAEARKDQKMEIDLFRSVMTSASSVTDVVIGLMSVEPESLAIGAISAVIKAIRNVTVQFPVAFIDQEGTATLADQLVVALGLEVDLLIGEDTTGREGIMMMIVHLGRGEDLLLPLQFLMVEEPQEDLIEENHLEEVHPYHLVLHHIEVEEAYLGLIAALGLKR